MHLQILYPNYRKISVCLLPVFCLLAACSEDEGPARPGNQPPEIRRVASGYQRLQPGAVTTVVCYAVDQDYDSLIYSWSADAGTFVNGGSGSRVNWQAPATIGDYELTVSVSDGLSQVEAALVVQVAQEGNPGQRDFLLGSTGLMYAMVRIEPDSFIMGAAENESGADISEYPGHTVRFSRAFWMGLFEVTQAQWQAVMDTCPAALFGADHPVENVSWNDVQAFIDSLNSVEDTTIWRLPSEAEWEFACRAGTTTRFPWGDDTASIEFDAWSVIGSYNGIGSHAPIGSRLPNAWGLYDMIGNVWEWCEDRYHRDYEGAPEDGSAWTSGRVAERMLRGGSWYDVPRNCRSAVRNWADNDLRYRTVGFRLVRDE